MAAFGNIEGTVTVTIGDGDPIGVATFAVPVTTTREPDGSYVLHAVPVETVREAAAEALRRAADDMLAAIPMYEPTADQTDSEAAQ